MEQKIWEIERITEDNYTLFEDMIYWRQNGMEREPSREPVPEQIRKELRDPNLYVYAAMEEGRYIGWISLVYIPKIGKWGGHGHVYVDELWVAEQYRRQGCGKALMSKADELRDKLKAAGIRLYVNVNNPGAKMLYEGCGYREDGRADFMEKQ
ncbi:MAG: GNAT family N-acetyltransferase [Clostridia bacterium]|nr:GNAT family N-acetyltransferase [Clostridia bacterium]